MEARIFFKNLFFISLLITLPSIAVKNLASENDSNFNNSVTKERESSKIKELSKEVRSELLKEGAISAQDVKEAEPIKHARKKM